MHRPRQYLAEPESKHPFALHIALSLISYFSIWEACADGLADGSRRIERLGRGCRACLEQGAAVAHDICEEAVCSGAAGLRSQENAAIRQYYALQQLKIVHSGPVAHIHGPPAHLHKHVTQEAFRPPACGTNFS